ncbi:potassium channel family protein [Pseudomonas monsensis]
MINKAVRCTASIFSKKFQSRANELRKNSVELKYYRAHSGRLKRLSLNLTPAKRTIVLDFKKLAIYALEFILSPTYFFADYKKSKQLSNQLKLGPLIKKFNTIYLIIALLIALALYLYPPTEFYKKGLGDAFIILAFFIIWAYPLSRANEIIYAFYRDAIEKLNGEPSRSDLKYGERIQLSLKSYLELIINFASIYILLPPQYFAYKITSYSDALYFSGVTITTLGYGDISPTHAISQLLSIYEVLCGFALIIVSFAVYTGRGIEFHASNNRS